MTFDVEDLLAGVKAVLQAQLNAKIAVVESEKANQGKAIGLKPIDPKAYFEQSWSDEIMNRAPAIFYGIADTKAEGAGPATSEIFKLFVEVVVIDSGMDQNTSKRVHRYSRAIKEVLQENFASFPVAGKIKIETVVPGGFRISLDTSDEIKVGGVVVTAALA